MNKRRLNPLLLLVPAIVGIVTSLITALDLVPRVRLVDVMIVFAGAVGGGAALAASIFEYRNARATAGPPRRSTARR
jgi:hypothetical protein